MEPSGPYIYRHFVVQHRSPQLQFFLFIKAVVVVVVFPPLSRPQEKKNQETGDHHPMCRVKSIEKKEALLRRSQIVRALSANGAIPFGLLWAMISATREKAVQQVTNHS